MIVKENLVGSLILYPQSEEEENSLKLWFASHGNQRVNSCMFCAEYSNFDYKNELIKKYYEKK